MSGFSQCLWYQLSQVRELKYLINGTLKIYDIRAILNISEPSPQTVITLVVYNTPM